MSLKLAYFGTRETADEALDDLIKYTGPIAVDTETISLQDRTCIGIGLATDHAQYYFQTLPETSEYLPKLSEILSDFRRKKIYFNALFDIRVLNQIFSENNLPRADTLNMEDVATMSQVQGRESNELDVLAQLYLGESNPYTIRGLLEEHCGKRGSNMLMVPFKAIAEKNWHDTRFTLQLYEQFKDWFPDEAARDSYDIDRRLMTMCLRMETPGLLIDHNRLEQHYERLKREQQIYEGICNEEGFNPGSWQQVGFIVASRGVFLPFQKDKRNYKTDEDTLEKYAWKDPLIRIILQHRKVSKLLSTYVEPFREAERAYTHFRLDLATGRLASGAFGKSHPHVCRNQQNIPNRMRDIFVPDADVWDWMDYSQIEMRILANLSHDKSMLEAFRNGVSIHELSMNRLWPGARKKDSDGYDTFEYLTTKTFNFAMAYLAMDSTLAKHTKLPLETVANFKSIWLNELYPGVRDFMYACVADPSPVVVSEFGRRMRLPDLELARKKSEEAGHWFNEPGYLNHINKCKINYKIQGTAADIIKRGMLMIETDVPDLRLQVHDELVNNGKYEWPKELENIHPEFSTPFESHSARIWT